MNQNNIANCHKKFKIVFFSLFPWVAPFQVRVYKKKNVLSLNLIVFYVRAFPSILCSSNLFLIGKAPIKNFSSKKF